MFIVYIYFPYRVLAVDRFVAAHKTSMESVPGVKLVYTGGHGTRLAGRIVIVHDGGVSKDRIASAITAKVPGFEVLLRKLLVTFFPR